MALFPVAWFLLQKQKIEFHCEQRVLHAQELLVQSENQLLALNPQVDALVLDKKMLEKAILLAVTPAEKTALTLQLVVVLARMRVLRAQQLLLIKGAEVRSYQTLWLLESKIKRETRSFQQLWRSPSLQTQVHWPTPRIYLQTLFSDPLLPNYLAPPTLPVKQTLPIQIEVSGVRLFPEWLEFLDMKKLLGFPPYFRWQESCSSHPQKGGLKWESYLGKGKFL